MVVSHLQNVAAPTSFFFFFFLHPSPRAYVYVCLCDIICEPPTSVFVFQRWKRSPPYSSYMLSVSPIQSRNNVAGYTTVRPGHTCTYSCFMHFCPSLRLQIGILLSLNHSCAWIRIIIPKDSFCPHSLIHGVTHFSVESGTRENPLRLISSLDTPTCRGVTAGCPSSASQPELMSVPVCTSEVRCPGRLQRSMRMAEHLWIPRVMFFFFFFYVTNFLIGCVALQKTWGQFPVYCRSTGRPLRPPEEYVFHTGCAHLKFIRMLQRDPLE